MFKDRKKFNQYMAEWKKEYRKENPEEARRVDRVNRRRWVKNNPEVAKEYMNNYMREWLLVDVNRWCHSIRTRIACLRSQIKKFPNCKLKENNQKLYENLKKIGWEVYEKDKNRVVNHICSLPYFWEFKENLSMDIVCDSINMEICDKRLNSRVLKRTVNKRVIATAKKLEAKFPEQLKGFYEFIKAKEGIIK